MGRRAGNDRPASLIRVPNLPTTQHRQLAVLISWAVTPVTICSCVHDGRPPRLGGLGNPVSFHAEVGRPMRRASAQNSRVRGGLPAILGPFPRRVVGNRNHGEMDKQSLKRKHRPANVPVREVVRIYRCDSGRTDLDNSSSNRPVGRFVRDGCLHHQDALFLRLNSKAGKLAQAERRMPV
jgi:hypothetical protein